jgi:hypothetical protein
MKEDLRKVMELLKTVKSIASSPSKAGDLIIKAYRTDCWAKRDKYLTLYGLGAREILQMICQLKAEDYLGTTLGGKQEKLYAFAIRMPEEKMYFKFEIVLSYRTDKEAFEIVSFHPINDFFKRG